MSFLSAAPPSDSRPRAASFLSLFVAGTCAALLLQWHYARDNQGWAALLHVGELSGPQREFIEEELGSVPLTPHWGHDGRFSYVIARDPFGTRGGEEALVHPRYRFRRYLYSLLSGGFGFFGPRLTLAGLVGIAAMGFGLLVAAAATLGRQLGLPTWTGALSAVNPGILESLTHVTSDALALGLSTFAVVLAVRGHRWRAAAIFSLAVLTKEVYLLMALGVAAWQWQQGRRHESVAVAVVPGGLAALWAVFLAFRFPYGTSTNQAFGLPFEGLIEAVRGPGNMLSISIVVVAAAMTVGLSVWRRQGLIACLALPWIVVGIFSSALVWYLEAPRVLAPLWSLMLLALFLSARKKVEEGAPTPVTSAALT